MKTKDPNRKPNSISEPPVRKPGQTNQTQTRIVIENIYESRAEPSDGVAVQMTLLFFTARPTFWVRASKIAISHFHSLAHGGARPQIEVISNPEAWFVKVVCTLFVRSHALDSYLGYLSKNLTPSIAFEVIRRLNHPKLGLKFFELSRLSLSVNHSVWTYNFLLRSLCQIGLQDSAKLVFDYMRSDGHTPDDSIAELLVSSYAQMGKLNNAENLLDEVHCGEVRLSPLVYNNLFNVLVKQNKVEEAVCLFRKHMGSHCRPDSWTFNILIRGLCRIGEIDKAFEFFSDMESFGCYPDIVTYNTLISGLCRANEVDRGCHLLKEVQSRIELSPDVITFTSVISGYCKLGKMEEASVLFDEMNNSGVGPTSVTFNALIDGFGKSGNMISARAMYEKMLFHGYRPDVITFTSLIDGYCRAGKLSQGLKLWQEMNAKNVSPSAYTFSVLINALCKENRLQEAREFLRQLKRSNVIPRPFIYNPVIDGFCKAGNVDEANLIVAEMEEKRCSPDKVTFTILILGNCMKGRMSEAISNFKRMLAIGCAPDNITVDSLISCLMKAGMPNEAHHIKKIAYKDLNLGMSPSLRADHLRANAKITVAV
ncbi:PREDICTED: pentatricopeptide [Prunus dulcis]|uniref:PREDICTED: pentatricopeptide n=1 Tax=Prunus dulcis TaxID=3755 RepID=A0A5E4E3M5_PRUDU|nr:pentatricopeptide repeat-containing protein At2g06000 [Prunus dulcis]VVA10225.1 PREDICTED: pentatricopeptide [Prunus dulcis]